MNKATFKFPSKLVTTIKEHELVKQNNKICYRHERMMNLMYIVNNYVECNMH